MTSSLREPAHSGPPSRSDLNKAATQAAMVTAAVDLVLEQGLDLVTVDAVAERAGVSRRTFFNYFPSLEACVGSPVTQTLLQAVAVFEARPQDEPPLVSATHAFTEVFNPQATPHMVRVMRAVRHDPRLLAHQLMSWHGAADVVAEAMRHRMPEADDLWVRTLASSVLGTGHSAVTAWLSATDEQDELTAAASASVLHATITTCFGYLAEGFSAPPTQPRPTQPRPTQPRHTQP